MTRPCATCGRPVTHQADGSHYTLRGEPLATCYPCDRRHEDREDLAIGLLVTEQGSLDF